MQRSWLARFLVVVTTAAATAFGASAPAHAVPYDSIIQNSPGSGAPFVRIGVGVIHLFDLSYTHGAYDTTLQPGASTNLPPINWTRAEGIYIGPGYCAQLRFNGEPQEDLRGPVQRPISQRGIITVTPYRAKSASRCV